MPWWPGPVAGHLLISIRLAVSGRPQWNLHTYGLCGRNVEIALFLDLEALEQREQQPAPMRHADVLAERSLDRLIAGRGPVRGWALGHCTTLRQRAQRRGKNTGSSRKRNVNDRRCRARELTRSRIRPIDAAVCEIDAILTRRTLSSCACRSTIPRTNLSSRFRRAEAQPWMSLQQAPKYGRCARTRSC